MSTVRSADGTTIAYTRAGQGPPLILVDGALCSRSFGPMPKLADRLAPRFTVYTYDRRGRGASSDTKPYAPDREVEDLEALVALAGDTVYLHGTSSGAVLALEAVAGHRPGDAVKMFMRFVGAPAVFTAIMPITPVWGKLKAAAPTLPYDLTIMHDHQQGAPLTAGEWAAVKVPTLVAVGGKSPAWMANGTRALAGALPDATYRTLPGQNHMVKAQAIAPVLTEFFTTQD